MAVLARFMLKGLKDATILNIWKIHNWITVFHEKMNTVHVCNFSTQILIVFVQEPEQW